MKRFKFLSNINFKVNLIVVLIILASSISVFFITYNMLTKALENDMRERANRVTEYLEHAITAESFTGIDSREDESGELYRHTQILMNTAREIANIQYLYTAKKNDGGELIYVIDGLNFDNEDFRHVGDLIEEELIADLLKCFDGSVITSDGIINTKWGYVYVTYTPVKDADGNVVGAVGMEFNADHILGYFHKAGGFSIILSAVMTVIFILISKFSLKKVSEPFYKKMAYTDILTGIPNRMAFEEKLKECEAYHKNSDNITFIIFDLNNLKMINDSYGHTAGDEYIKNSASLIRKNLSHLGEVYRVGGDEIAAVILGYTESEVQNAINLLYGKEAVMYKNYIFDCAYGMASFDAEKDSDLHSVFMRADNKMYEQKRREKQKKGEHESKKPIKNGDA